MIYFKLIGKPPRALDPGLGALDVREHLAFVVGGAAGVDVAVAAHGLERRRRPLLQRIGRLNVVMPVDQRRRGPGDVRRLAVDQRMAAGGNHLVAETELVELVGHPGCRPLHVRLPLRVGADAGDPQEFAQFFFKPRRFRDQIFVDCGHPIHLSAGIASVSPVAPPV